MFSKVHRALAEVEEIDLDTVAPEDLNAIVEGLQGLRARLEAAEATVLSRWDAQRAWDLDGARNGSTWLAWRLRLPVGVARQRVRHARALRTLPQVAQAWSAGQIDRCHVVGLLGARTPRSAETFEADHSVLLEAAQRHCYRNFKAVCDRWALAADPDGAEQGAESDRAGRELQLSQSFGGMW